MKIADTARNNCKNIQRSKNEEVLTKTDIGTNDNSNPQQGTGGISRLSSPTHISESNSAVENGHDSGNRVALKIPPTSKDPRKLFVGGLPSDITNDEFRTFFSQYGEVMDSVVMFDRETKRSRGFGFVTFNDSAVCDCILSLCNSTPYENGNQKCRSNRLEMRGKLIEVKEAEPKQQSSAGRRTARGQPKSHSVNETLYPSGSVYFWGMQIDQHGVPFVNSHSPNSPIMGNFPTTHLGYEAGMPGYMPPMYCNYPNIYTTYSPNCNAELNSESGYGTGNFVNNRFQNCYPMFAYNPSPFIPPFAAPFGFAPVEGSVMQPVAPGIPPRVDDAHTGYENKS